MTNSQLLLDTISKAVGNPKESAFGLVDDLDKAIQENYSKELDGDSLLITASKLGFYKGAMTHLLDKLQSISKELNR